MPRTPAIESDSDYVSDDEIVTGEAVALDVRPAGFVLRAAGAAIDLIVYFGFYILLVLFGIAYVASALDLSEGLIAALAIAMLVLAIVVAPLVVEVLSHGKSLGKLAVGARIVRDDGGAIGFRHSFIRALAGVLEVFMTFGGIAIVVSLLNNRSKRLGDLLAGTYSQYERVSKKERPVYGVPVQLQEWSLTADVARMPDRLSRRIASYLAQAAKLTPQTRLRVGNELAAEAAAYVSPLPAVDAELFLAAIAAVRRDREYAALALEARGLERLRPVLSGLPNRFPER